MTLISHTLSDKRMQILSKQLITMMDILSTHFKYDNIPMTIDGFTRFDIYIRENCPQY